MHNYIIKKPTFKKKYLFIFRFIVICIRGGVNMKSFRKILSLFISFIMAFSMILIYPMTAMADGGTSFATAVQATNSGSSYTISSTVHSRYFYFIPAESAAYTIYSNNSDFDSCAWLYSSDDTVTAIAAGDDENGFAFSISVNLTEGTKYYLKVSAYGNVTDTFNIIGKLQEETPNIQIDYENEKLTGFVSGDTYTINSITTTPDSVSIDINEDWFGANISIVKKGDGTTITDSSAQSLTVPSKPSAPNAVVVNETYSGANDGEITGLDSTMEYSTDQTNWTSVSGTEITGLSNGTYYLRVKATTDSFASSIETVAIGTDDSEPEETPNIQIDFENEELTGFTSGAAYSINGTTTTSDSVSIDIDDDWFCDSLSIVKKGNGTTTTDSTAQSLSIPSRPTIDNVYIDLNTNSIVVTCDDSGCEFSIDGKNWQDNGTFTGLESGTEYTIYVRKKATKSSFRSLSDKEIVTTAENKSTSGESSSYYYTITASAGDGGSISPIGSVSVEEGEYKTYTITPKGGYRIENVTVDGDSMGAVESYSFENVNEDHTIKAEFEKSDTPNEDTSKDNTGNKNTDESLENTFKDISETDWFYNDVLNIYDKGIMSGITDNEFGPSLPTTRGMIAVILYRLSESTEKTGSSFSYVASDKYYYNAIGWAEKNGFISGYDNGMFGPNDNITREQIVSILWRYAGSPETENCNTLKQFNDYIDISEYAKSALAWAYEEGIISGKGNKNLDPKGIATRAEVAKILSSYLEVSE
jgi:hypothetical protein